jgi:site-specific DNA-methyltransferase (cytosine-N4-specific)
MITPYWADETCSLYLGDALTVLREMPDASADCCVTSPPYFSLRDYRIAGQIGQEDSPGAYVERLREVFAEVHRVLADDGTLWLNVGDSYYSGRGNPGPNAADPKQPARRGWVRPVDRPGQDWGTPKSLIGIPWRIAFALQADGWTWRNVIPWYKPNAMPHPVEDRLANKWEPVLLLAKSRHYQFDLDALREPVTWQDKRNTDPAYVPRRDRLSKGRTDGYAAVGGHAGAHENGRNPGDFWKIEHDPFDEWWDIATTPFPGAHDAVMPVQLATRCIKTTRPGATVLDPFSGAGTTGEACRRLGRRYVGIDLNPAFHDLAVKRYAQGVLGFGEEAS